MVHRISDLEKKAKHKILDYIRMYATLEGTLHDKTKIIDDPKILVQIMEDLPNYRNAIFPLETLLHDANVLSGINVYHGLEQSKILRPYAPHSKNLPTFKTIDEYIVAIDNEIGRVNKMKDIMMENHTRSISGYWNEYELFKDPDDP